MILGDVVSRLFAYFFPLAVKYITILFFWFFFFYRKSATDSINTHTNVTKRNIRNLSPIPLRHLNKRSDELHLTPEPFVSFAKIDQLLLFCDHLGFLKHKKNTILVRRRSKWLILFTFNVMSNIVFRYSLLVTECSDLFNDHFKVNLWKIRDLINLEWFWLLY